jgi:hypothetical protein
VCLAAIEIAGSEISSESILKIDTLPVAAPFNKAPVAATLRGKGLHADGRMGGQVSLQLHR